MEDQVTPQPWDHRGLAVPHSTDAHTLLSAVGFRVQLDVNGIREHTFTGSSIRVMPLPLMYNNAE